MRSSIENVMVGQALRRDHVFIYTLNLAVFFWLIFMRPKKVFYVSQRISNRLMDLIKSRMSVCQTKTGLAYAVTPTYYQYERNIYLACEKLFMEPAYYREVTSILGNLGPETERLVKSLKKYALSYLYRDIMAIQLAQEEADKCKDRICVLVNDYKLMSALTNDKVVVRKMFNPAFVLGNYLKLVYTAARCFNGILFKKGQVEVPHFKKINIVIEEIYKDEDRNAEFASFFQYFKKRDDVLYLSADKGSQSYKDLRKQGKPVLAKEELAMVSPGTGKHLLFFLRFLFHVVSSFKLKSVFVKKVILQIYYQQHIYESLFERFKPRLFLKIRSDYSPDHPIVTAVANRHGAKHVGYMHGSYCGFYTIFGHLDFHCYGMFGKRFREKYYSDLWPETLEYKVLGPLTVEVVDTPRYEKKGRFIVGVFPRQIEEAVYEYSYAKFVENIWVTLFHLNIPDLHVVFKESISENWSEEVKENLCRKYRLSYETVYHRTVPAQPFYYSGEIIAISDIVLSAHYAHSTVAFEAIGKGKKVVVLEPDNITPHPFEEYPVPIVAKSLKDLDASLQWLINTPQDEYEKLIQPIIRDWSKISDGNLVKDFIESIEGENNGSRPESLSGGSFLGSQILLGKVAR